MIRPATTDDAKAIAAIYNHFVRETTVTFEEVPVSSEALAERIATTLDSGFPYLVFEQQGKIVGYAYAGAWHRRSAYRFTAESTVYLAPGFAGKGYGRRLYRALLERLTQQGIRQVMGVIALPNEASRRLHESLGFRQVGEFEHIGRKFERAISVGYWQLSLPQ